MKSLAALAVVSVLASGCATGVGVWKGERTPLPYLVGAAALTFAVTTAASSQIEDFTAGAALATGLAVTAVDVGVACLFGACKPLHP